MSGEFGVSIDVGTSGIRAQAVDLGSGRVLSTAITMKHPIPGANVMDHLSFSIERGGDCAHNLIIGTINQLLDLLEVDLGRVVRVAVCGNPIQLSIFEDIEIRDLAYAGEEAIRRLDVDEPDRSGKVVSSVDVGLELGVDADVYIPPAIKHEVGADALAMMVKTDFLERDEPTMVTDYGTNAEMAIKTGDDEIYSGSAAAGPAIEGQHISRGMLASPGSICDVDGRSWRSIILDSDLNPRPGDIVNPKTGEVEDEGEMHLQAEGITGTGVIAAIAGGLDSGLIDRPKFKTPDGSIYLQDMISVSEEDYLEASKAFGAIRAGHMTLLKATETEQEDLHNMYMSGASGTYVDARKAQEVGLVPPSVNEIHQVGNTSLSLATDLVRDPGEIDRLQEIADSIRARHIMFAESEVFEKIYIQELAFWQEGMPFKMYNDFLERSNISRLPTKVSDAEIYEKVERDIIEIGDKGLKILKEIGGIVQKEFEGCNGCQKCLKSCPEKAIKVKDTPTGHQIQMETAPCLGHGCLRCEQACPENVLKITKMDLKPFNDKKTHK
ncbi:methylamine methyltransferase corrinoid protein reductive activase [Methanonatronarchaeum sp. AMET-Sl]|uniref:methylamine methyltransferase corrinoid protein reductive activase n=1 Tax=Methanonatronarchaeum sp. AMET-Sl TaxID=3037654 RepID=UPI00244DA425|nr:methylamine methyltransferase corrinoid protein reductive activase [Methanonatronarchaeum sp. AMET-Sl]WGI16882.1 methylamine methyltransferase corrinoid protein reductive activase [Methanonatronarchaeum sp. AMET-Sl]